ncbi:hypothetical protein K502DRAFT_345265 [Neoconidiobolus thromboides FSU 785]|nr:hypothetical protein K502DRAFT_345265 [Neoconidiobolus thromboides FSU 785]
MVSRVKTLPKELIESKKNKGKVSIPLTRCLKMVSPYWYFGLVGAIGALLDGITFPMYALLLTNATQSFFDLTTPGLIEKGQNDINFWSLMFLILAIGCLIAGFMKYAGFNTLGEHLTYEIRRRCFRSLLTQEVGFYDAPENLVGIITGKLSTEAENVQGLVGKFLGPIFSVLSCAIASLSIAFSSGWKLTLVALATAPLTVYGQLVQVSILSDVNEKTKLAYLKVSQIAMESILNKRTINSLNREAIFFEDYLERVEKAHRISREGYLKSAIGYSFAMCIPHFINALLFWYGTTLIISQEYTYNNMFQVVTSIMFMGNSFGIASGELTSFVKSKIAANDIFALLDRTPKINQSDAYGNKNKQLYGNISNQILRS